MPTRRSRMILMDLQHYAVLGDGLRHGIAEFAAGQPDWRCGGLNPRDLGAIDWGAVDGVLGVLATQDLQDRLLRHKIPAVNTMHGFGGHRIPCVYSDDHAIGRLAAEHLIERGHRRLAVIRYAPTGTFADRADGFADAARASGAECIQSAMHYSTSPEQQVSQFIAWLESLPLPVGIFCGNDSNAQHVLEMLQSIGRRVPDEVAVIGADNAPMACMFSHPALSSVQPDWRRIGYEASVLLDRLMQGDPPPDAPILIPPVGVVTRRSTDALAIADREVADAVRFIADHAAERIDVNDILRAFPVARRSLERKFRKHVGHSPARHIKQAQIQHIKRLLIQNDWPMPKIAAASAFHDPSDLSKQFRKETGLTPTAYRRQHRSY